MTELKQMSGDEFVTKILAGERDFRRIRLQQGYNFNSHEGFNELRDYIAKFGDDLREHPLNLIGSALLNVKAKGLSFQHIKASASYFNESSFSNCKFYEADFANAHLKNIQWPYAQLYNVDFRSADLR